MIYLFGSGLTLLFWGKKMGKLLEKYKNFVKFSHDFSQCCIYYWGTKNSNLHFCIKEDMTRFKLHVTSWWQISDSFNMNFFFILIIVFKGWISCRFYFRFFFLNNRPFLFYNDILGPKKAKMGNLGGQNKLTPAISSTVHKNWID